MWGLAVANLLRVRPPGITPIWLPPFRRGEEPPRLIDGSPSGTISVPDKRVGFSRHPSISPGCEFAAEPTGTRRFRDQGRNAHKPTEILHAEVRGRAARPAAGVPQPHSR